MIAPKSSERQQIWNHKNNLIMLLNSPIIKEQIKNMTFIDITLPTLYKRYMNIVLPLYGSKKMKEMDNIVKNNHNLREIFWDSLDHMRI